MRSSNKQSTERHALGMNYIINRDDDEEAHYFWTIYCRAVCETVEATTKLECDLYDLLYGGDLDLGDDDINCDNVWFQRYNETDFPGVEIYVTGGSSSPEPGLLPLLGALEDLIGDRLREALPSITFAIDVMRTARMGVAGVQNRFRPITSSADDEP